MKALSKSYVKVANRELIKEHSFGLAIVICAKCLKKLKYKYLFGYDTHQMTEIDGYSGPCLKVTHLILLWCNNQMSHIVVLYPTLVSYGPSLCANYMN